jgi:uncharacterized protein (TIGR02453 family)
MNHLPPFPGFRQQAFDFLTELKQNNDREWFKERKAIFDDEVWWVMQCLVADAGNECAARGLPLMGDPQRGLFRIYRDTRFSKEKTPYKTHVGAVLSRDGTKKNLGDFYIHVEDNASFIGGGWWQPEPSLLNKFRQRMSEQPDDFMALKDHLENAGMHLLSYEGNLKRLPRGYEQHAESPVAEFLKWKSIVATKHFSNAELMRPDFTHTVVDLAQTMLPLLEYGWEMME